MCTVFSVFLSFFVLGGKEKRRKDNNKVVQKVTPCDLMEESRQEKGCELVFFFLFIHIYLPLIFIII